MQLISIGNFEISSKLSTKYEILSSINISILRNSADIKIDTTFLSSNFGN